jgi:TolB-like protein
MHVEFGVRAADQRGATLSGGKRIRGNSQVRDASGTNFVESRRWKEMTKNDFDAEFKKVITSGEVLRALERVLASKTFVRSHRLSRFLRFAVEQALDGRKDQLKEYTIGTLIYGRRPDFDPSQDSIVRVEARRLRTKLKEYREGEGWKDDVVIVFHPGSYVPTYRRGTVSVSQQAIRYAQTDDPKGYLDPKLVALTAFESPACDPLANSLAFSLTDELLHRMTQLAGVRVLCSPIGKSGSSDNSSEPETVVSGVVRTEGDRLFITAREATTSGLVLWSQRFESATEGSKPAALYAVSNAVLQRISQRAVARNDWTPSVIRIPTPVQRRAALPGDVQVFAQIRDAS